MKEKPNFHKIHEERNILRKEGAEAGLSAEKIQEHEPEGHRQFRIKDHGDLSRAKEAIRRARERHNDNNYVIDHEAIREAMGDECALLEDIETKSEKLAHTIEARAKKLRSMTGNPKKTELYKALISALNNDLETKRSELAQLEAEHPDIVRIKDLLAYRGGLFEEGHIAEVPSVQEYLARIEEAMIEGKPMFLHGPTGTGKTSLAIRTAKKLTGSAPEIVYCNPQTKESNIFGKTGIGIDEKTEKQVTQFDYGPLVRAMNEGKVVVFDEFTALPKDMMVMLKGIMNAKPGDPRTIPGNGEIPIAPGFQMIFTANLKSEKNQERQDIPPEMANEFAQNNIEVLYQSEPESYDIMLARLINPDGTLDLSEYDAMVTLPQFAEAIREIQKAYTTKVQGDLGESASLKKLVFNQRTVENILARFKTSRAKGEERDFVTFLDAQLKIPLTFKEYSEKDRTLAAKILARQGFLTTVTPEALDLPSDTFAWNAEAREKTTTHSAKVRHYSLKEVAKLDPFGVRGIALKETIDALLPLREQKGRGTEKLTPDDITRLLTEAGSPATLDESFGEKGIVSFDIDPQTVEALKTWPTAQEAYKSADNTAPYIWPELLKSKWVTNWQPPATTSLDVLVLNHGQTTSAQRDTLVTHMDTIGYRPLTFSELVALGIIKPDLQKQAVLNTYMKEEDREILGGYSRAPSLRWGGSERDLGAAYASRGWFERNRFLFVRK